MKLLLKVVAVLPKREFPAKNGEKIEVVPLHLMQGRDQFVADAVGADARSLPENLGGGDNVWCELSFSVREWDGKDGQKMYGQSVNISKVERL